MPRQMPEDHRESAVASPGIGRNAMDWAVVSVGAMYGASTAAYPGKTCLSM